MSIGEKMKKKQFQKKLVLNKTTIVRLDDLKNITAGGTSSACLPTNDPNRSIYPYECAETDPAGSKCPGCY